MTFTAIPGTMVRVGLGGLRLPILLLQRVTAPKQENWPPAVAYDSLEAELKIVLGSLVGDQGLVHEGVLQHTKAHEVALASHLERKAGDTRSQAEADFKQSIDAVDEMARRADLDAHRQAEKIGVEQAVKKEKLEQEAQVLRSSVARRASARDKAVRADVRKAARTRVAAESAALSARGQALSAANRAETIEKRIEAQKAARKS